jgi:acyl-CoA thioester hydrolase
MSELKDVSRIVVVVRYAETDRMGVVHHTNYLVWFEAGRTEYMRERGTSYRYMEEQGIFLPVSESHCRLVSPAHYEDSVTIETWIESVKSRQVTFGYQALRDGKVLATGSTVHICTDAAARPMVMPAWVKSGFVPDGGSHSGA